MWFNQPTDMRILSWRNWRQSLENKPKEDVIKEVASTWAKVPTVSHLLAPDTVDEWPRAWRLITDNYYCDLGICLGMFYSLVLIDNPVIDDIVLNIYQTDSGWINLSLIDQGKYVLNFDYGQVVNSEHAALSKLNLKYSYSKIDLLHKFS